MSSSILEEAVAGEAHIQPWTVEQYHWAIEHGFLEESSAFELLDGFIVRKNRAKAGENIMTVGDRHALVVQRLVRMAMEFSPLGCHLRIQQPIAVSQHDEPEPDASVVIGTEEDFADHKPVAGDVSCVIEVADSSLNRDLGSKLRMYALGAIQQYIVVDLVHNVVLDHRSPEGEVFKDVNTLSAGSSVHASVPGGRSVSIRVERLLP